MNSSSTERSSPYKGLIPYAEGDAPFFFGREKETRLISANLFASPLTLLYGASGVGKSSVLRAGVAHQLRQRDDLLVVVFNSWQSNAVSDLKKAIAYDADLADHDAWRKAMRLLPQDRPASLTEFLAICTTQLNRRLMIILDQFEEYFLYHPQDDEFAVEFPRAVTQTDAPVSFLISIREDFYAKLDRFEGRIPTLYDNYLRIEHLDRKAARAAVEKPIVEYNRVYATDGQQFSIEPELVAAVLKQVETGRVILGEAGRGVIETAKPGEEAEAQIETPFLQLVMTRLWEKEVDARSRKLQMKTLELLGGAENIVRKHLDAVISKLTPPEQEIAANIFHYLVTPSGTKIAYIASDLAGSCELNEAEVVRVLEKLSHGNDRILRRVDPTPDRPTAPRYEIFHDVLAPAILTWRTAYVQAQERAEAERQLALEAEERGKAEQQLARERSLARRLRWALVGLVLLMIAMGGLTVYAFQKQSAAAAAEAEAVKQRKAVESVQTEVVKQKARAETQRDEAERAKADAVEAKTEVTKQKAVAVAQRDAAEKAAAEAVKQRNAAQIARADAEEANAKAQDAAAAADTAAFEAGRQKGVAEDQRRRAEQQTREARFASSNLLAIQAKDLNERYPQRSLLLAVEALKTMQAGGLRVPVVEETLRQVLAQTGGQVVSEHKATVSDVALSPRNDLLVTVDRVNKTAKVWDLTATGATSPPRVLTDVGGPIAISPDGHWLVTGSYIDGRESATASLWDLRVPNLTAKPLRTDKEPVSISTVEVSPDSHWLVTSDGHDARLWNLTSSSSFVGTNPHIIRSNGGEYFVSPDQRLLMTIDPDNAAQIWDLTAKDPTAKSIVLRGRRAAISAVAFSRDNRWVLTGAEDATARLWDLTVADPSTSAKVLHGHTDKVSCVAISQDSHWLVTGSLDGTVRLWDLSNPALPAKLVLSEKGPPDEKDIGELYLSPDNHWLVTRRHSWAVGRLWDLTAANHAPKSYPLEFHKFLVSPDGHWLATMNATYPYSMSLFNLKTDDPVSTSRTLQGMEVISEFAFSPDSHWLCTEGPRHAPRLWDLTVATPGTAFTEFPGGYDKPISEIGFTPDGRRLVTRNYDGAAYVWDLQNPAAEAVVLHGDTNDPGWVRISADSRWLVTSPTARLWDLTARDIPENSINLPVEGSTYSVDFSGDCILDTM